MKKKVLATLLLSLLVVPLVQSADQAPRLVVGITVDQLRTDYLMALQHLFGEKGFKRLMKEGVVCENLVYDYPNVDKASATATLYTGTMPFFHGIPSERFFNTTFQRKEFILNDPSKIGNYTQETFSPERLKTSTISDEVKIVSGGLGRVYAVAPDAQQAIISAGHAGNCAFWINDRNGKWATTTYYRDVPAYIEQFNYGRSLSARIDTLAWTPVYTPDLYTAIPYLTNDFSFKRTFSHDNRDRFAQFKTTALVNREITDVAVEFLDKGLLGRRGVLDMLNVGYTAGVYLNKTVQEYGLELQDTYVRLDRDLARLLDEIDKKVGLDHTVIFVASTGYFKGEAKESPIYNIPSGEFYPRRAVSLLNVYLMALYGQGDWVIGYQNRQIFLNRKLIKERDLDADEMRDKAASFLIQMAGVQDVYTMQRLLLSYGTDRLAAMRNGYCPKLSGDLVLDLCPGWEVVYEDNADTREYVRINAIPAPCFILAPDVKPVHIATPVRATAIAPTVSRLLRIRSPNGSSSTPLSEIQY